MRNLTAVLLTYTIRPFYINQTKKPFDQKTPNSAHPHYFINKQDLTINDMFTTKNLHPFRCATSNMMQSQRPYREVYEIPRELLSPIDDPARFEDSVPSYRGEH